MASNAQRSPFPAEYQSHDINSRGLVTVAAFFFAFFRFFIPLTGGSRALFQTRSPFFYKYMEKFLFLWYNNTL